MRIACLQFAPQVGDVQNNLNRADAVLLKAAPKDLDLLVLPELAFSGYNFSSLKHITPYLEPTTAGVTSLWARTAALKYNCVVTVGYPEKVDVSPKWPTSQEYYNSTVTVNAEGETIANYRKSFLYYTDETWALEGNGFYEGEVDGLGKVAMGICMDLNPYKFEAPWNSFEFAHHVLDKEANLVILSMAWLTRESAGEFSRFPKQPDMETLSYWLARLEPLIRAEIEGEIIVVLANRCGTEDDVVYAGTSAVLGIQDGEVRVYGLLGRGEKELLVIDTDEGPRAKIVSEPNSAVSDSVEDAELNEAMDLPEPRVRSRTNSISVQPGMAFQENTSSPDAESPDEVNDTRTPWSDLGSNYRSSSSSHVPMVRHANPIQDGVDSSIDKQPRSTEEDQDTDSNSMTPVSTQLPHTSLWEAEPLTSLSTKPPLEEHRSEKTLLDSKIDLDTEEENLDLETPSARETGTILSTGRSEPMSTIGTRPMSTMW